MAPWRLKLVLKTMVMMMKGLYCLCILDKTAVS